MRTTQWTLGLSVFASVLLFSCKKENKPPSVNYQLKTTNATSSIGRTLGGSMQWTSGYASASEIEFEAESNTMEVEYKSEVKKKVDLFASSSILGSIIVPPGTYKDIEFEMEIQQNGSDAAIFLSGKYTNSNGTATPVIFRLNESVEIEAEKENITITEDTNLNAMLNLNLSLLTAGVTESMFNDASRTNGAIEISATSNSAIYKIILNNLKNMAGVEVD